MSRNLNLRRINMFLALSRRSLGKILNKTGFQKRLSSVIVSNSEGSDGNIIKSDASDVELPVSNTSIHEYLFSSFEPYQDYCAAESATTGKKYTYSQLRAKSITFGKALRKKFKLSKGDVVGIFMANDPDFIISLLGILSAGLVVTTMNPMYTPNEVSKQLLDGGVKVLITQDDLYKTAVHACNEAQLTLPIVSIKQKECDSLPSGAVSFDELVNSRIDDLPDIVPANFNDLALLLYSSGTTGTPKGVELTHLNILGNLIQTFHPKFNVFDKPSDHHQDVVPVVLPMYHLYGLGVIMLTCLFSSAKVITVPKFTPPTFMDMLQNHQITHLFVAPPLVLFLTSSPDLKPQYLSHLRVMTSAAAPLKYSDELRFIEKIQNDNCFVRQGYGLTETGPIVTLTPVGTKLNQAIGGSVGQIMPNTSVKIVAPEDQTGKALGPNKEGELLVKGFQVMRGYLNRKEETENAFQDGWFKTGDIGYYNEEKFFYITDRIKELIKVKGFQVPPAELEGVIRTFPGVEDVGVVGIPHSTQGEVPRAYVVVRKGHQFKPDELNKYVGSKLAKYKQLVGGIKVIEEIPRNPSGKILRRILKEEFLNKGI